MIEEGVYEFLEVIEISEEVARTAILSVIAKTSEDEKEFNRRMRSSYDDKMNNVARIAEAKGIIFNEDGLILSLQVI